MKELNPLLHSQLRLAVISILMNVEEADFVYLKEKTESTAAISAFSLKSCLPRDIFLLKRECRASVPGRHAQLLTMEERLLKNMSRR